MGLNLMQRHGCGTWHVGPGMWDQACGTWHVGPDMWEVACGA